MKTYIKPSGVEVEVHPDSYALAESLGWKVKQDIKQDKQEAKPKHKGK